MADQNTSIPPQPTGQSPLWDRLLMFFIFWGILSFTYMFLKIDKAIEEIPYSVFKTRVEKGQVAEIEVKGQNVKGEYRVDAIRVDAIGAEMRSDAAGRQNVAYFKTVLPSFADPELVQLLERQGVVISASPDKMNWFATLVITLLPWVLIIGYFVYMNKRIGEQMGGAGPFGFAKSKAKRFTLEEVHITFNDVAGLENAKNELVEVVDYLKNPLKFERIGAELPRGILLAGPPGTGKTLMARAMAGEAGVPFFSISGSEFIEMFVGVGASRVRDLFDTAKKAAPSLIFIDELDSIGRVRGTGVGGGHDEREQTLNQILSEIDGFSPHESVIVIAATNRPDVLDPALIRPGRFDRQVILDLPQRNARREILKVHAKKRSMAQDIDFDMLAGETIGFSGADLKNLVNEAALLAVKKEKEQVEMDDFTESRDKILMGVKREERLSDAEKKMVAYHEAGHALTALLLPGTDRLRKVTIIPRGRSLGATEQMPEEDRHNLGRKYLLDRIAVMLGGRAAEEEVFGDITSGAGDDLKQATQMARHMVCQWGMSKKVGLVVFKKGEPHPFLGRELTEDRDYSEATATLIDEEVRSILEECRLRAQALLQENREKLDQLAHELLLQETLSVHEIEKLLNLEKAQAT
jgi:cell division protease FtsH